MACNEMQGLGTQKLILGLFIVLNLQNPDDFQDWIATFELFPMLPHIWLQRGMAFLDCSRFLLAQGSQRSWQMTRYFEILISLH